MNYSKVMETNKKPLDFKLKKYLIMGILLIIFNLSTDSHAGISPVKISRPEFLISEFAYTIAKKRILKFDMNNDGKNDSIYVRDNPRDQHIYGTIDTNQDNTPDTVVKMISYPTGYSIKYLKKNFWLHYDKSFNLIGVVLVHPKFGGLIINYIHNTHKFELEELNKDIYLSDAIETFRKIGIDLVKPFKQRKNFDFNHFFFRKYTLPPDFGLIPGTRY